MPAVKQLPNLFPWMEKIKAAQELQLFLMYGSCDCCGDTLTKEGDMIINKGRAIGKSVPASTPTIAARYCKHCKILLDDKG